MKKIMGLALIATFGFSIWALFHLIDAGAELDSARSEQVRQKERAVLLRSMLRHTTVNLDRSELVRLLTEDMSGSRIVKRDIDRLEIDDVIFTFRDNKVSDVLFLGEH